MQRKETSQIPAKKPAIPTPKGRIAINQQTPQIAQAPVSRTMPDTMNAEACTDLPTFAAKRTNAWMHLAVKQSPAAFQERTEMTPVRRLSGNAASVYPD